MSLVEKYRKVLEIIKSGADLKDDTYLSQFLESTESVIEGKEDVARLGVLGFIKSELGDSQLGSYNEDQSATLDTEIQSRKNFIVDLSTSVIKSVPELACGLIKVIGICDVSKNENICLIPMLQFFSQVFQGKEDILDITNYLCQENQFWEKFLEAIILKDKNKYVTKATVGCVAHYVKFLLEASEINSKPKGCEIRVLLESNLRSLLSSSMVASTSNNHHTCDIFEILNKVIELLDLKSLNDFLIPLIKENIDFSEILNGDKNLTATALKCYILSMKTPPDLNKLKEHLESIFMETKYSLKIKKIVIVNIIQFPELSEVLEFVIDQFIKNSSDPMLSLCRYFFSFHTVKPMLSRCKDVRVAQKVFSLISKYLEQYSENLSDQTCSNTFIRNVCQFSSKFLHLHDLKRFELSPVMNATLNISKQKYEANDFVRSGAIDVLSAILRGVDHVDSLGDLVKTLCGFVCDLGTLNMVRDSALSCIASLLFNKPLAHSLSEEDIGVVTRVLLRTMSGKDQLLKSGAVVVETALIENLSNQVEFSQVSKFFPSKDVDPLCFCDIYNDEERKELMKLASKIHEKMENPDLLELVKSFVLTALDVDTNWDVKVHSVMFWKAVYRKACDKYPGLGNIEELLRYLEKHSFFTGIILGYQDYEESVKSTYFQFMINLDFGDQNKIVGKINCTKRKVDDVSLMEPPVKKMGSVYHHSDEDDGNRYEEIEDILEENDKSLVKCLADRSTCKESKLTERRKVNICYTYEDLLKVQLDNPDSELSKEAMLESVLDEIIQSSSDENLIDLVDCY